MSNRPVTVSDLTEALRPLIEALNLMRTEQLGGTSQVSEIHRMTTDISVKLDAVDQNVTTAAATSTRTTGKKLVGRKGAGDKKPAKRGAKKVVEPAEEDDAPAEDEEVPVEEEEVPVEDTPVKTGKSVKKTVKKTAPKAAAKQAAKPSKPSKKATAAPKKKLFNRMNFFRKEFEQDESQFSKVLTKKVQTTVESDPENVEALKDLEDDALKRARANIYYHYLKDNKPEVLESLRAKFDAENAAESNDTEDVGDAEDAGDADEPDE